MKKYRVALFNCMGEIKRRVYTDSADDAVRVKRSHGIDWSTIMVWAGKKNGWHIAPENAVT